VSEAQGLAVALDLPVAGISTLDIIALPLCDGTRTVAPILPAGRGDVYLARYVGDWRSFRRDGEYARMPVNVVAEAVPLPALLAGPAAHDAADGPGWTGPVAVAPSLTAHRRPGYLAELGRRALLSGGAGDAAGLRPLYLRPSSAEEVRARGLQE
jgi:tRNA threonylcarbamoyladenosine biosynthesis protein TsaB